jgi:hypothetical protein
MRPKPFPDEDEDDDDDEPDIPWRPWPDPDVEKGGINYENMEWNKRYL